MRQLGILILLCFHVAGLSRAQEQLDAEAHFRLLLELRDSLPDSALYHARQAELFLQKEGEGPELTRLYEQKGRIYEQLGSREQSLLYFRKAYDGYIRAEAQEELGIVAAKLGHIYYDLADFSEAYYFYMHSLNAFERIGDQAGIASLENSLGTVAHEMGKLEEAEQHYLNSYEIYLESGSALDQSRSLNNIALILYDREILDSAILFFEDALSLLVPEFSDDPNAQYILSGIYNNIALAFIDMEEYRNARDYLFKGLRLARLIEEDYNVASVYVNLGALYRDMGKQDSSLYYLHRSLKLARDFNFRHLEMEAYNELARLHAVNGSYASAYNWQLRYDTLYKEVFNESQSEQIARLRSRYEQELTDRQIEQLHAESQLQGMLNKIFVVFIVVVLSLAILAVVNLRARKLANKTLAERNDQLTETLERLRSSEQELQSLNESKDRIFTVIAHDLRNPVAAVSGFSELLHENFEQFSADTQKNYVLQIVQGTQRVQYLLENLLVWARSQMNAVQLSPEHFRVDELIEYSVRELKASLDHKNIICHVDASPECSLFADRSMIQIVLRNLIGNAIKFSFPGGNIWVRAVLEGENCLIRVSDEGIGIQPEIQEKLFKTGEVVSSAGTAGEPGSGLGLVICRDFVELCNGSLELQSESGKGATFSIRLPADRTGRAS